MTPATPSSRRSAQGSDRLFASTSYILGAGISIETMATTNTAGSAAINLTGNEFAQIIYGNAGNNILNGGEGADTLVGFDGDDILIGGEGAANTLQGGTGNDTYVVSSAGDTIVELDGEGTDQVRTSLVAYALAENSIEQLVFTGGTAFTGTGNSLDNLIVGGAGDDTLSGLGGNDTLVGGGGNDTLSGGSGNNALQGGAGNDVYIVASAGDTVIEDAGEGTDTVRTDLAAYALTANVENLTYTGAGDFIGTGNALANVILGGSGADELNGGAGDDTLVGGAGSDLLSGGSGNNTLQGGTGNDVYIVSSVGDTVVEFADEGTDQVRTDLATYNLNANVENLAYLGGGNFVGNGNALANLIAGGAGADELSGLGGDDSLVGNDGSDFLKGGEGNDDLSGGLGNDLLDGGNGADRLIFNSALGPNNVDTVLNFATGQDRILLDNAVFAALADGALPASAFVTGSAAADADDRIIYDPTTGALLYDADGNGAGAAIQFATMPTGLGLSSTDFLVI